MNAVAVAYYAEHPTAAEIAAITGGCKWAVCRKTPKNLARYDLCLTQAEWTALRKAALATRKS